MNNKDNTIGFQTLVDDIKKQAVKPFEFKITDDSPSFQVIQTHYEKYVQPVFSTVSYFEDAIAKEYAQIILISAVGATGKSTLAKELSYSLKCPLWDLGNAEVIAGNSLTGTIFKKMTVSDGSQYMQDLQSGCATMIIDGLDEGYQRTKTQGYFDFLDDVISMTAKHGKSFILLGRTNAIELAALHFESRNVKTVTYQIEPFYLDQARDFIRLQLKSDSGIDTLSRPYKELLDYIIEAIGGFFKDRQEVKTKQYERFIGYAPVLLSIAEYLRKSKNNFQRVLSDFQKDQLKGNMLIISIVEGILRRDKELKIMPQLIDEKLKGRTLEFQAKARREAYTEEEQCARVLYRCLGKEYNYPVTGDEAFDLEYSQGIERWMDEHPFLTVDKKISNTVFEGYILARLISVPRYRRDVDEYIERSTGISYMFFSIYQELHKEQEYVDLSIVSYLYSSLKALDNPKKFYKLELAYDEDDADELTEQEKPCTLCFEGSEDSGLAKYQFNVLLSNKTSLPIHNFIGDVYIDAPIKVEIMSRRMVLSAPGYINCKSIDICTDEIVFSHRNDEDQFVIEAETVELIVDKSYPNIIGDNKDEKGILCIVCDKKPPYPLDAYQTSLSQKCAKLTSQQKDYYQKMRRALIMFRSHSKGNFAKVQSKIDSRIGSKPDGRKVLNALLEKEIIYPKDKLYFIDKAKMNEFLGLKFDSLRTCVINDKVTAFLSEI